jgi:ATP-binding cassette subfamily B (MDR/TAP) protein 1
VPVPNSSLEQSASSEKTAGPSKYSFQEHNNELSEKDRRTSTSSSSMLDEKPTKKRWGKSRKDKDEEAKKAKQKEEEANAIPSVGFFSLFRFAKFHEIVFNIIGLVLAAAAGATQPLMTLIFGRLTTSFTNYAIALNQIAQQGNTPESEAAVQAAKDQLKIDSGHNALYLLAIGVGMFICTYCYMFIWNWTGEINAKRVRENYLRAVLRQEVSHSPFSRVHAYVSDCLL